MKTKAIKYKNTRIPLRSIAYYQVSEYDEWFALGDQPRVSTPAIILKVVFTSQADIALRANSEESIKEMKKVIEFLDNYFELQEWDWDQESLFYMRHDLDNRYYNR